MTPALTRRALSFSGGLPRYNGGVLADHFVDVMRCPVSKQPLVYFPRGEHGTSEDAAFLLSVAARLRYRIDDGVPVLIADEATSVDSREVSRLVEVARSLGLSVPP